MGGLWRRVYGQSQAKFPIPIKRGLYIALYSVNNLKFKELNIYFPEEGFHL